MFDIGFWEMAFIGVIALLVVGPDRLPKVAREVGSWIGKARRMIRDVKTDIKSELSAEELREFREFKQEISGAKEGFNEMKKSVTDSTGMADLKDELKATTDEINEGLNTDPEVLGVAGAAADSAAGSKSASSSGSKKKTSSKAAKKKTAAKKKATKKKVAKKKTAKKKTATKKTPSRKTTKKTAKKSSGKVVKKASARKTADTQAKA